MWVVLFYSNWIHIPLWKIHLQVSVGWMGGFSPLSFSKICRTTHLAIATLSVWRVWNCLWDVVLRLLHQGWFGGSEVCCRYFTSDRLPPAVCLSSLQFTACIIYVAVLFFLSGFHMPIWNIFTQVRVRRTGKYFPLLFCKIRRTTHLTIAELSVCYIQFTHRSLCGMWGILHFVDPSDRLCHRYSPLTPSLCLSSLYLKFTTLIYVAVLFFSRWIHIPLWNIHLQVSVGGVGKFPPMPFSQHMLINPPRHS